MVEKQRVKMVDRLKKLLAHENDNRSYFIYGGYQSKPSIPYGNYARQESQYDYADDTLNVRINEYIVRVVTETKDFELEEQIENAFIELEIPFSVITDEDVESEKVHCVEWYIACVD